MPPPRMPSIALVTIEPDLDIFRLRCQSQECLREIFPAEITTFAVRAAWAAARNLLGQPDYEAGRGRMGANLQPEPMTFLAPASCSIQGPFAIPVTRP